MTTFEAIYEREGDAWLVHVASEPRAHTYGRSLAGARRNTVEAIELWFEVEPGSYQLIEEFPFHPDVTGAVSAVTEARERLARAQNDVYERSRRAAHLLVRKEGLSLRDAATLLGVSHQRVHQLVD